MKFSLSSFRSAIDNLFVPETKSVRRCVVRASAAIFIPLFSSVFPASITRLALSARRLRVRQANFAIKQSDARTAIVMTLETGREKDRTGSSARLRLI